MLKRNTVMKKDLNLTTGPFSARSGSKSQKVPAARTNPSPTGHIAGAFTARGKALSSSSNISVARENNDNRSLPGSVDILSSGFAYPRTFARSYARQGSAAERERDLRLTYFNYVSDTAEE